MSKIKNKSTITEPTVQKVRSAMQHRAVWLYLLMKEAEKAGLDFEEIARKAITSCGCFHGEGIISDCTDPEDLSSFGEIFADEDFKKYFEMEIIESEKDILKINFHHCPLVEGWRSIGCTDEEIDLLCDISMDGDRGIAESCDCVLTLGDTIAKGGDVCEIVFTKKSEVKK